MAVSINIQVLIQGYYPRYQQFHVTLYYTSTNCLTFQILDTSALGMLLDIQAFVPLAISHTA